jgi:hypothetical protein
MALSLQEKRALKKKSSSLGVELQPLVVYNNDETYADTITSISYGAGDEYFQQEACGLHHDETKHQQPSDTQQRAVQLMRPENLAIPFCYLCVGLMQGRALQLCGFLLRMSVDLYPHITCVSQVSRDHS